MLTWIGLLRMVDGQLDRIVGKVDLARFVHRQAVLFPPDVGQRVTVRFTFQRQRGADFHVLIFRPEHDSRRCCGRFAKNGFSAIRDRSLWGGSIKTNDKSFPIGQLRCRKRILFWGTVPGKTSTQTVAKTVKIQTQNTNTHTAICMANRWIVWPVLFTWNILPNVPETAFVELNWVCPYSKKENTTARNIQYCCFTLSFVVVVVRFFPAAQCVYVRISRLDVCEEMFVDQTCGLVFGVYLANWSKNCMLNAGR